MGNSVVIAGRDGRGVRGEMEKDIEGINGDGWRQTQNIVCRLFVVELCTFCCGVVEVCA